MSNLLFPSHLLSESEASKIIDPHLVTLSNCFGDGVRAWQRIRRNNPDECLMLPTRTWAGIIHANTVRAAQLAFRNMAPDIMLYHDGNDACHDNKYFAIDFYGKLVLRFKKLRRDLHPSCYKTEEQKHFDLQEPEELLYGPAATLATAGYRLDRLAATIKDIHIVAWLGNIRLFLILLPLPAAIAMPIAVAHQGKRRKTRVRAKGRRGVEGQ
ncbi:MAG: hypothetical protein ABSH08_11960 [Tepidisphaeraceae bacterium]|jgi:hypothetical protein